MTTISCIEKLRDEINRQLRPLFKSDYRLLEIPDYPNIGDVLIFEGERQFLRTLPYRCKEMSTMTSFAYRLPKIPMSDLLVLSGGGYFGDLWPKEGPAFQAKILEAYPENPMVILPQSVCFTSKENLESAVRRYGAHKNLTICLRDRASYEFVIKHFSNPAVLAPDMAFYSGIERFADECWSGRKLFILRKDKEQKRTALVDQYCQDEDFEKADWPTMEAKDWLDRVKNRLRAHPALGAKMLDWFTAGPYRRNRIRRGIDFIKPYSEVVSTRLHGGIMAMMLGKDVTFLDNSYGKIRALYETWLRDCEKISFEDE